MPVALYMETLFSLLKNTQVICAVVDTMSSLKLAVPIQLSSAVSKLSSAFATPRLERASRDTLPALPAVPGAV